MPYVFTTVLSLSPNAGNQPIVGLLGRLATVHTKDGEFLVTNSEMGFQQLRILDRILQGTGKVGLRYTKKDRRIVMVINPEDLQLPVSRSTEELRIVASAAPIDEEIKRRHTERDAVLEHLFSQRSAMSEAEPPMQPQDWNGFHSDLTADELGYRKTSTKRPPAFSAYLAGTFVEADSFAELIENLVAAQVEKLDAENANLHLELADKDAHIERYARQKALVHLVGIVQRAAGTPLVNLNTEIQDHITALQLAIEQDRQEGR